jgi:hypothetical protein
MIRGCLVALAALLVVAIAGGALLIVLSGEDPDPRGPDPNPSSSFKIVALGDSYISGEGAARFFAGTDRPGSNECRRAATAHPYLVAEALEASLTFVACSGARTAHVTGVDGTGAPVRAQYPDSPEEVFGGRPQVEVLAAVSEPNVVVVSIGGNDAGFLEIGAGCATPAFPDCRRSAEGWIRRLDREVFGNLVRAYGAVRRAAPQAEVFALTYPNPLGPKWCGDIWLNRPEMSFVRDVFIPRLNTIIRTAASTVPIRVIDVSQSLDGSRFCELPLSRAAVNFVSVGRTRGTPLRLTPKGLAGLAHGTFHPNRLGHELMYAAVLPPLRAARDGGLEPLGPGLPPDLPPPPFVPDELGSPAGPDPFPEGTACSGRQIEMVIPISLPEETTTVPLTGVKRGSVVCFREYRAEWRSRRADATGRVEVPVSLRFPGIGSINEVLAEWSNGGWRKLVVSRLGSPRTRPGAAPPARRSRPSGAAPAPPVAGRGGL